jgi:MFS family permease
MMTSGSPPGLRDQLGATVNAAKRLGRAHVNLAKAEAGEIAGEVGRLVALVGLALGFLFAVGLLLAVGLPLFLAEWLLGSMGWGVLIGAFLLLDLALITVLVALGYSRGRLSFALLVAIVVGAALGAILWTWTEAPHTVDVALGIWVALVAWPILAGIGVARRGIDGEALKQRFMPDQTIELTKETIEWVRARTPLAPKS